MSVTDPSPPPLPVCVRAKKSFISSVIPFAVFKNGEVTARKKSNDDADTVQVLVTLGADLKAKNQLGETPSATGQRLGTSEEVLTFLEQLMGLVDPPQ